MDWTDWCQEAQGGVRDAIQPEQLPVTSVRRKLGCPRGIEFGSERVLVLQPLQTLGRWLFCGVCHGQNRR